MMSRNSKASFLPKQELTRYILLVNKRPEIYSEWINEELSKVDIEIKVEAFVDVFGNKN